MWKTGQTCSAFMENWLRNIFTLQGSMFQMDSGRICNDQSCLAMEEMAFKGDGHLAKVFEAGCQESISSGFLTLDLFLITIIFYNSE